MPTLPYPTGMRAKWAKNGLLMASVPIYLSDARRQGGETSGHALAGPMAQPKGAERRGGKWLGILDT